MMIVMDDDEDDDDDDDDDDVILAWYVCVEIEYANYTSITNIHYMLA